MEEVEGIRIHQIIEESLSKNVDIFISKTMSCVVKVGQAIQAISEL
jgi:hypothetical protein